MVHESIYQIPLRKSLKAIVEGDFLVNTYYRAGDGEPYNLLNEVKMDIDIEYVAALARIDLSKEQQKKFTHQLEDILGYIEKLKELDVTKVEPMSHVLPLKNVFRPDKVKPSLPLDKVLANAPEKKENSFSVPRVIE